MSRVRCGDITQEEGVDELDRYLLILIAREYKNREAQWLGDKIRDYMGYWGPSVVKDVLLYGPDVLPRSPSKPLSKHFKGCGMVFMLDSWKDDAIRANFRAIPHYIGGHNHLDQCSFSIFHKGGLALDSGIYDDYSSSHRLNYYCRTIAHNTILVEDPNEDFSLYGVGYVADGGQAWKQPPRSYPYNIQDLTETDLFDLKGIVAYEDNDLYTYSLGNGAPAYSAAKMSVFYRHFVWLKSLSGWNHPVVVVFDEVESKNSAFKKTYLLHTQNQPTVNGSLISASAEGGLLYQRTVFPASAKITLVGGSGKEYWVDGRNYAPTRGAKDGEEPGSWRLEVCPSTARTHDEFLHVLYATEAGAGAPPSVRAIDASSMKGFESQNVVMLFAVKLGSITSVSYSTGGGRQNILFGLTAGRKYDVYVDEKLAQTALASDEGSTTFSTSAAAQIRVVRQ